MAGPEDYLDAGGAMKIIWMQGEKTSTDLIRVLAERFDWSKSTVQTLLARLVEKECLTRKKEGKSFVYSALLTLDQSRDLLVQDIKDKVCSRRIRNLLADLIVECEFTQTDLEDLEAVISEKKSSAVTEVRCNCM
ncbi:CopY/TcrY family copper transport repressor [Streptococcus pneumoniae]|uniref:CopY/TcrY family copper transport repressor n=2 Tax=Streptococcus pneumoniae TaxID=1313 RepID=UPI003561A4CD